MFRSIDWDMNRCPTIWCRTAFSELARDANFAPLADKRVYFSYQRQVEVKERTKQLFQLGRSWKAHNASEVLRLMRVIGPMPDYVVVPSTESEWANGVLPYRHLTTIRNYAILKHQTVEP